MSPQRVHSLNLIPDLFPISNTQGRELRGRAVMKCTSNIGMCQNTWEPICFKLGMMLNTTKLYSWNPIWMSLMFTQGHRVTGNMELVQSFCCEVAWRYSNVRDGWLCKEGDCEEVLKVWRVWVVWAFVPLDKFLLSAFIWLGHGYLHLLSSCIGKHACAAAMLKETIEHYYFMPDSVVLTLSEVYEISKKQNLLGSYSLTLLIWLG